MSRLSKIDFVRSCKREKLWRSKSEKGETKREKMGREQQQGNNLLTEITQA